MTSAEPLAGRRVVVTRAGHQAGALRAALARLGAEVIDAPALEIAPPADPTGLERALAGLAGYEWVAFTSANAVDAVRRGLEAKGANAWPAGPRIASVGESTSEAVEAAFGGRRPDLEATGESSAQGLLRAFADIAVVGEAEDGLQAVEKILLVEEIPVFARASADDIQALALAARETRLIDGATLVAEGDVPAIYLMVSGEVALEPLSGGQPLTAGPGDTFGVYETLSGSETTAWRVHVTRGGLALRVDREVLFDVLADRIELLQAMFSAVLHRQAPAVPA